MASPFQNNLKYSSKEYWDERYKDEYEFEWFAGYEALKPFIDGSMNHSDSILTLGCGNSRLSEDMYRDGYKHMVNTDYSEVVIDNMRAKTVSMKEMTWEVMDIFNMTYDDNSFDVILEKGTLDAFLVGEKDPWRMSAGGLAQMDTICKSVSRILKPGGRFVSITFAQPHFRAPIYAQTKYKWDIRTDFFGETFHYFFYIMTKGKALSAEDIEVSEKYFERLNAPIEYNSFSLCDDEDETFLTRIMPDG